MNKPPSKTPNVTLEPCPGVSVTQRITYLIETDPVAIAFDAWFYAQKGDISPYAHQHIRTAFFDGYAAGRKSVIGDLDPEDDR